MIFISHRGNINGINLERENDPKYVLEAINKGYECEIDVWFVKDRLYLGHDEPQYEINLKFLQNDKFWCHAKNLLALEYMLLHGVHCFWHQSDDYTITSKGVIWAYPGKELSKNSICVMPERHTDAPKKEINHAGICSDYIEKYRRKDD
jgi:hypothetical protein